DIYVLNMQGDDHFYVNDGGKRFLDRTEAYFPKTPWGTMGVKFFDYNNDGKMDLVLTDMHSDMTEQIEPEREKLKSRMRWSDATLQGGANNIFGNAFYVNRGKEPLEEASDRLGTENYWPWGVSVGDLNADGWEDMFYTASMNYPFRYGINSVLLNEKGEKFLDSEFALGVEPRRGGAMTTDWMVLDCSGADRGHQHCRGREGEVMVRATLGSRSSLLFDADGDGDLDIVANEFNSEPQVLLSSLSDAKKIHYLEVRLVGTRSNRDGLGARVRVVAGDRTLTQIQDGKSGYLSQSSVPLYFGLGAATKADRVEIDWPSGAHQVIKDGIPVNGRLEVVEPKAEAPKTMTPKTK
ncbi:MAG: CRTAC1 family protein, partial [Acidobacteria bacterium]|nr:CRTAC1 family protein [Acidobacteriota bacterium]